MAQCKFGKIITFIGMNVLIAVMVSCGMGTKDGASGGQTFRINIAQEPSVLDPFQFRDDRASSIIYALHEPLLRMAGENGKDWEGGLATDFTVSPDAITYRVNLRRDAQWSDGTPITADDVVYSFQRVVDPAFASEKASDYYLFKNAEAIVKKQMPPSSLGVTALDQYTIEFTMEKPVDYFIDYLKTPGYAPIQKAAGQKFGGLYGTEPDKMVFSGPFTLTAWAHNATLTLVKNPNYWDAANVKLEQIEISLVMDTNSTVGMYQTGELDFLEIPSDLRERFFKEPGFGSIPMTRSSFIEFNPNVEFLNNIKIREALSIAFDRRTYAAAVMHQPDIAAYGLVPFGMRGPSGGDFRTMNGSLAVDTATDPAAKTRAVQLLADGLSELGKPKSAMEAAIKVLCVDSPDARTQAQAIQAMWKENLGLSLPVVPMEVKMLIPMLIAGTFDCVVGGGRTAHTPDPAYMIDFVYDENKWDDATFRKMIEDSRIKTGDERLEILMDAEKYLMNYYVYIPQVYAVYDYVLNPQVKDFRLYPYGVQYDYKYASK